MRSRPPWLITDDVPYEEVDLGSLKTGKEAEVFVVERHFGDSSCLLAFKRYRPRTVTQKGELAALGFQRANSFMNDSVYRDGRRFAKSRDQRAADRMTKYGKRLLTERWTGHELDVMQRAWEADVNVPYPVEERGDGMLMEYVGNHAGAAPRLAQARLGRAEMTCAFAQVVDNLHKLVGAGFVHSDLSAYNVLWWENQVWLIDFPQAVDVTTNPHAFEFLHRDVNNVCDFFGRRGIECDADDLYNDLVAVACAF